MPLTIRSSLFVSFQLKFCDVQPCEPLALDDLIFDINVHSFALPCNGGWWRRGGGGGGDCRYNYSPQKFVGDHARVPSRVMVTTESFPDQSFNYWDAVWKNEYVIGE